MPVTIPSNEPTTIVQGDTVEWRREDLSDFPAPTWTLTYNFVNECGSFSITATADGTNHAVAVPVATSDGYKPGLYRWSAFVTDATPVRHRIDSGWLTVEENLATATSKDVRSHSRKVLDAIEAIMEDDASIEQANLSVEGRSLSRRSVGELLTLKAHFEARVLDEDQRDRLTEGRRSKRTIYPRFSDGYSG